MCAALKTGVHVLGRRLTVLSCVPSVCALCFNPVCTCRVHPVPGAEAAAREHDALQLPGQVRAARAAHQDGLPEHPDGR